MVVGRGTAITRWKLDGSGAVTRVIAPGWVIRDRYSPTGSSLVVARRADGVEWWEDYREFAVLDTRTEKLTPPRSHPLVRRHVGGRDNPGRRLRRRGPHRTGFLDIRTAEPFSGDPLPDDAVGVWMNAEGDRMYVGRPGGEIWTVDPATGRRIEPTMQTDGGDPVLISTSPDGSRVLVTSWNMEYTPDSILFDGETGERIRAGLVGIGLTALTARDEIAGTFRLQSLVRYDADTFERIGALPGASGGLDTMNVSADGRILSTYSLDNTVTLYDLVGGVQLGDPIPVSGEWNYRDGGRVLGSAPRRRSRTRRQRAGRHRGVGPPAVIACGCRLQDGRPRPHARRVDRLSRRPRPLPLDVRLREG